MAQGDLLTNPLRKFPLGVPNWNAIRQQNLFFVDKTAQLGSLVTDFHRVFMFRPHLMGKTTLCSILAELFAHGDSEKFAGTAIHGNWPVKQCFPVIYLSLRGLTEADDTDEKEFEANLCKKLIAAYVSAGFKEMGNYASETSFYSLAVHIAYVVGKQPLVFLVDNWDAPLSPHLNQPQVLADMQKVLQRFYSWLCEQAQSKFILITGIMRYRESSLFRGQDFDDLSMEPRYAKLLGYTQEDLEGESFAPYMTLAADRMGITVPELLEQLKLFYCGFCFDEDASVKVYCPYSMNKFFYPFVSPVFMCDPDWVPELKPVWMNSCRVYATLRSYFNSHPLSQQELVKLSHQKIVMPHAELQALSYLQPVTLQQILVLGGYFSIKAITEATRGKPSYARSYLCGITNNEVSKRFVEVLGKYLQEMSLVSLAGNDSSNDKDALLAGDKATLCASFNQSLNPWAL